MASDKKGKRPGRIKDIRAKKVGSGNAKQVQGGFNPQPEPPMVLKYNVANPILKKLPIRF